MSQEFCLNCEYCIFHQSAVTINLVGTTCTHGQFVRPVDPLYTCKDWVGGGGYFDIQEITSSDEAVGVIPDDGQ